MALRHLRLRRALIDTARRMNELGINQGTSGNLSVRLVVRGGASGGLLITPSGVPYEAMVPADIIEMAFDGTWRCAGPGRRPSSEWRFHLDIMRARPEFGAVIHTHARHATALACLRREIPAFHYMVAVAGGSTIRCAPYATFGTAALSRHVLRALAGRRACLLANHGLIACGRDLAAALALAVEVETLAAQYCTALAIGKPKILSEAEMARVIKKFEAGYGRRAKA
ncbi:MAG: class II aldolase [Alphaproteobacteria bacterium]|nr:MAG: class II aldolase [Alphaproteobacteria bacterium]